MKIFVLELKGTNKIMNSWNLERDKTYIIGRSSDQASLVIGSPSLSRQHCKISVTVGGSLSIQDLDSANGTFVDGKRITSNQVVILRKGTEIVLGEMKEVLS
jgi:pSer/pThr/pTyr-binding forkhead associated (FHA) protein